MRRIHLVRCLAVPALALPGCATGHLRCQPDRELVLADRDLDGLPEMLEAGLGTDVELVDTDGDSLSDYWEANKYRTNPTESDSDGDGTPDGDWEERAEFARTLRAVVDLRPPFHIQHMNDFYQDARVLKALGGGVTRVEVVLYPEAIPSINASTYKPVRSQDTAPSFTKNYSPEMQRAVRRQVEACTTDVQAVEKILRQLREARHVDLVGDLGCECDLPAHFYLHRDVHGAILESAVPTSDKGRWEMVKKVVVFANSMWRLGTRGACGSTAILRGALLRAAGIPEKTIMTIPLLYSYETDGTEIDVQTHYSRQHLDIPEGDTRICDHFLNEAWIGGQWVRVDNRINPAWGDSPTVKILECHDPTDVDLRQHWNYETWRTRRPYKYLCIIERPAKHKYPQVSRSETQR